MTSISATPLNVVPIYPKWEVFQNNGFLLPLTSPKQNSVKLDEHQSNIDFGDPFERGCFNDVFLFVKCVRILRSAYAEHPLGIQLNVRGVPKQWNLVASHIPKTKLCKIWQSSMLLRSTTTTNIMLVVFGDVRGVPKQWILVASHTPQNKTL